MAWMPSKYQKPGSDRLLQGLRLQPSHQSLSVFFTPLPSFLQKNLLRP